MQDQAFRTSFDFSDLQQTDFFVFFNLHEKSRKTIQDGSVRLEFKTGGFQEFIDIEIYVDKHNKVRKTNILLDRSWFEDSSSNVFARDLAKSFIATFVPAQDEHRTQRLAAILWDPARETNNFAVKLEDHVMSVLEVFAGQRGYYQLEMSISKFVIENTRIKNNMRIRMEITIN